MPETGVATGLDDAEEITDLLTAVLGSGRESATLRHDVVGGVHALRLLTPR